MPHHSERTICTFFEVDEPKIKDNIEVATGGAVIEFKLENDEKSETYDVDALCQFVYSGEYVVSDISETLYQDPCNRKER